MCAGQPIVRACGSFVNFVLDRFITAMKPVRLPLSEKAPGRISETSSASFRSFVSNSGKESRKCPSDTPSPYDSSRNPIPLGKLFGILRCGEHRQGKRGTKLLVEAAFRLRYRYTIPQNNTPREKILVPT